MPSIGIGTQKRRAAACSPPITFEAALEIHRRAARGEAQHVIAATLGVNQGRISEVLSGKRWPQAKRTAGDL